MGSSYVHEATTYAGRCSGDVQSVEHIHLDVRKDMHDE
jgi:phosphoribosyl-AMP cyclohydrolase